MSKYYIITIYDYDGDLVKERMLIKANVLEIENYDNGRTLSVLKNVEVLSNLIHFEIKNDEYRLKKEKHRLARRDLNRFRFFKEKLDKCELKGVNDDETARLIFECS